MAKQKLEAAFAELNDIAINYQVTYNQVVDVINEKLLGYRFYAISHDYKPDSSATWADAVSDFWDSIPGNLNNSVRPFNSFWQTVLLYVCVALVLNVVGLIFTGFLLNTFLVILAVTGGGMGMVALQTESTRQQFVRATKQEFVKYLPQIAEDQHQSIYEAVQKCFATYEQAINDRIQADIQSRQAELSNLIAQKTAHEIQQAQETQRLKDLQAAVATELQHIEALVVTR